MRPTLKATLSLLMGAAVLSLLCGALAIWKLSRSIDDVESNARTRFISTLLADELRQSSDDLTRLARTYVVTADPKWEKQYWEILDIRNGKVPRPKDYERIYWDFRAADIPMAGRGTGEAVSLQELMKRAGFTAQEFAKLQEAQANSDDLVKTETIAMNMVKGLYDDGQGGFTKKGEPDLAKARELMHDLRYHQFKAKIMAPLDEFFVLLDQRTQRMVDDAVARAQRWRAVALVSSIVLASLVVALAYWAMRRVNAAFQKTNSALHLIAQGDLSADIEVKGSDEAAHLMASLRTTRDKLASLIFRVRQNSEQVANASSEIAQGNINLSQRTEEQASALEETSATMEELLATVRNNADNAQQATQLALDANDAALRGGRIVDDVISTMKAIDVSSKKIADIIGVVDSIAFQTNILALNAAVEAARAGEQGRGFAVVASEVRSLAQRSANAAREIKALISSSVEQARQGSELVDSAGSTMTDVMGSIKRVADIVGEISTASSQQSTGVSQVGETISQMDQVTQQNAALVEQCAAASDSLDQQARELVLAISAFKVEDGVAG